MYPMETSSKALYTSCDILTYITNKSISLYGNDTSYVEFGSRLLRTRHSSREQKRLNELKNNGIIIPYINPRTNKEHYLTKELVREYTKDNNAKGICKKYRLNPIYSYIIYSSNNILNNNKFNPLLLPEDCQIPYLQVKKRYSNKKLTTKDKELYRDFQKHVDMLDIDYAKLIKMASTKIESTKIEDFKMNGDILSEKFEVMFLSSKKKIWITKEKALQAAEHSHETLIQDGKDFYIGSKEQFLAYKKRNMSISYKGSIERLKTKELYCKRNNTNNRLDHNFTSMPGFMVKEVMKDNKLGQWDIKNAQFAILSFMMEKKGYKTEDFKKFSDLAYNGNLYDDSMTTLDCATRDEAKTSFFETLFSKANSKSVRKESFKNSYPTVAEYVKNIKIKGKHQDVSIGLQRMEAVMCIDNLYVELKNQLDFVITKHDAFIVKVEDKDKSRKLIQDYFDKIGFKGSIAWEQYNN